MNGLAEEQRLRRLEADLGAIFESSQEPMTRRIAGTALGIPSGEIDALPKNPHEGLPWVFARSLTDLPSDDARKAFWDALREHLCLECGAVMPARQCHCTHDE